MTLGVYRRLSYIFESSGLRHFVEPYILDIEKEIEPEFVKPYIRDLHKDSEYYDRLLKKNENNSKPNNSDRKFDFIQKKPSRDSGSNIGDGRYRFLAVNPLTNNNNNGLCLSVTATRAYHNDFSEYSDSYGFKIRISNKDGLDCAIGYTGDTAWFPDIIDQYKNCNALIVHIGSLIDREKEKRFDNYYNKEEKGKVCWSLLEKKNHPYFFGLLRFLTQIADQKSNGKVPLVLLSEFGEELRGRIRLDLYRRLKNAYSNGKDARKSIPLLPVDVGLDVLLSLDESKNGSNDSHKGERDCSPLRKLLKDVNPHFLVKCVICEEFIVPQQIDFETYGHDEALYCVCQTCRRSTPHNVLQDKLRNLYEVARPLQSRY